MADIQRLCDQNTSARRTIADALEVFCEAAGFADTDRATVEIGLLKLPSGRIVGLVQLFFRPTAQKAYVVALPPSSAFHATDIATGRRVQFDVTRLHGATVDFDGHVSLADGTEICAIEVVPECLPVTPSALDWRIVHLTVKICGARSTCYRFLREGLDSPYRWMVPLGLRALSCAELTRLKLPPLKVLVGHIRQRDRTLKKLSPQKVADSLRMFGVRLPAARPRRNLHNVAATI